MARMTEENFDNAGSDTRVMIAVHGIANVMIGTSVLMWSNLGAETVLSLWFPSWLWPTLFIVAGLCAFVGLRSRVVAQFSFAFAAIITGVFAVASGVAVFNGMLGAVPTTVFLSYITYLKLKMAGLIRQREYIVQQIAHATKKGKSALEQSTDGTTS